MPKQSAYPDRQECRTALHDQCGLSLHLTVNVSLTSTRVVSQEEEVLRMAVPAPFNKAWLDTKLAGPVARALHKIDDDALGTGRVARVAYVIAVAA